MALTQWLTAWIDVLDEAGDYYTADGWLGTQGEVMETPRDDQLAHYTIGVDLGSQPARYVEVVDTPGDEQVCRQLVWRKQTDGS